MAGHLKSADYICQKQKKMSQEKLVSITEFASLVGIARKTVSNAIISQKIKSVIIEGSAKKLDPEIAAKEWLSSMTLGRGSKTANYEKLRDYLTTLDGIPPAPPTRKRKAKEPKYEAEPGTILAAAQSESGVDLSDDADIAEAKRVEAIWKARAQELHYEEAKKRLIPAADVRKAMYEFGAQLRQSITALPDRIIDELLSKNRQDAYIFLQEQIKEVLRNLADELEK